MKTTTLSTMHLGRAPLFVGGAVLAAGLLFASVVLGLSTKPDPRLAECGVAGETKVTAAFDMASAREYRQHFPSAALLPELDADDSPAFVVVMSGPLAIPALQAQGGSRSPTTYSSAVCVLVNHVPNIYPNLDLSGFRQ